MLVDLSGGRRGGKEAWFFSALRLVASLSGRKEEEEEEREERDLPSLSPVPSVRVGGGGRGEGRFAKYEAPDLSAVYRMWQI